jgi:hypothetical protein
VSIALYILETTHTNKIKKVIGIIISEAEISLAAMVPILPDVYGRYGSQVAADGS